MVLSYLGTDQAYLQRYFAAKSLGDSRRSILMDAAIAVPVSLLRPATPQNRKGGDRITHACRKARMSLFH
jgi:hypothetical protein